MSYLTQEQVVLKLCTQIKLLSVFVNNYSVYGVLNLSFLWLFPHVLWIQLHNELVVHYVIINIISGVTNCRFLDSVLTSLQVSLKLRFFIKWMNFTETENHCWFFTFNYSNIWLQIGWPCDLRWFIYIYIFFLEDLISTCDLKLWQSTLRSCSYVPRLCGIYAE